MINKQYAFMDKASVPTRAAWQAAIDESGFDFQLDPKLKPFRSKGFLPGSLMGKDTGFEIYYQAVNEVPDDVRQLARDNDYCIALRWPSDMVKAAAAMIASYTLAKNFGAIVSYDGEAPRDLAVFLDETKDVLEFAKVEI